MPPQHLETWYLISVHTPKSVHIRAIIRAVCMQQRNLQPLRIINVGTGRRDLTGVILRDAILLHQVLVVFEFIREFIPKKDHTTVMLWDVLMRRERLVF